MDTETLVQKIAQAAADKKSTHIVSQDLRGHSSICDYQIICSGSNERQTQAICSHIEDVLRESKAQKPMAIEGKQTGHWILMDYGDVMVHIFLETIRDYYAIERLWPAAASHTFQE